MHAKLRLRAKPVLGIHVQYYAATNAMTGFTKERSQRQPEMVTTATPVKIATMLTMNFEMTTTPVAARRKVRVRKKRRTREKTASKKMETRTRATTTMRELMRTLT